jgi:hypothetical protein
MLFEGKPSFLFPKSSEFQAQGSKSRAGQAEASHKFGGSKAHERLPEKFLPGCVLRIN